MKKEYIIPALEVVEVKPCLSLLAESNGGMPVIIGDNIEYPSGPGGDPFDSDDEVAAPGFDGDW